MTEPLLPGKPEGEGTHYATVGCVALVIDAILLALVALGTYLGWTL